MADTKTAAEWQQSINEANAGLTTAKISLATAQAEWDRTLAEMNAYFITVSSGGTPTQNIDAILAARTNALNGLDKAAQEVANLNNQVTYSTEQRDIALQNVPDTQTNTAPANPNPGNNVTLTTTTVEPITSTSNQTDNIVPYTTAVDTIVLPTTSQEQAQVAVDSYDAQLAALEVRKATLLATGDYSGAATLTAEIAEVTRLRDAAQETLQGLTVTSLYDEQFIPEEPPKPQVDSGVDQYTTPQVEVFTLAPENIDSTVVIEETMTPSGDVIIIPVPEDVPIDGATSLDVIIGGGPDGGGPDGGEPEITSINDSGTTIDEGAELLAISAISQVSTDAISVVEGPLSTEEFDQNPDSGLNQNSGLAIPQQDVGEDLSYPATEPQTPDPIENIEPNPPPSPGSASYYGLKAIARASATIGEVTKITSDLDWRVRLSLAEGTLATYFYRAEVQGILLPLASTNGIVFPYTPNVVVNYAAHYDGSEITHSNYKIYQYKSSSIDQIQITCDFTAQDTYEANYVLAVIHFLRSATKMFYGQDNNPRNGSPPPLCYLKGLGTFQFNRHPLAITSFNYALPVDVDYICATSESTDAGTTENGSSNGFPPNKTAPVQPTYVPTKIQIQITAVPIVSRNDISNVFSLEKYATGELLQGKNRTTGGIW